MENAEEVLQSLDEFAKLKPKDIPRELEDYLSYVAKTGDPVYQWSIVKCLFREKLLNVITEFYETSPTIDLPPCPNVDPFNYETMKNSLLERLDSFPSAPFTVQRLCELLTTPRKEYSRADKFMRAIEKNILVVSTREPGNVRRTDNNGQPELLMNGVMDGRGIELGEAIETVSSDGVNLMHSDENEVNVTENENMPVECSAMEDVDMEEQSENSNACNSNAWEKETTDVSHQNEDREKSFNSSEETNNKVESSDGDKSGENTSEEKATVDRPTEALVTAPEAETTDISKESCKETAPKLEETKDGEAIEVNSDKEQEVETEVSVCVENSGKTDEKEVSAPAEEIAIAVVEETSPKKIVSQQESSIVEVNRSNPEEVPSSDSSCSPADQESETSNTTESTSKDSPTEIAKSVDNINEASEELSATSPSPNTSAEETEDVEKQNVPAVTSIEENLTLEKEVVEAKESAAERCSSPQVNDTELSKHVDSKSEEVEVSEDAEVKEKSASVSEPQTDSTGQEEAMDVDITAAPQTTEEAQGCDEPMDQTEQPNEGPEEEGKS